MSAENYESLQDHEERIKQLENEVKALTVNIQILWDKERGNNHNELCFFRREKRRGPLSSFRCEHRPPSTNGEEGNESGKPCRGLFWSLRPSSPPLSSGEVRVGDRRMTDKKEPDLLFDQLCAIIRTTKNVLKFHYNITDEQIDRITSLEEAYRD